MRTMSSYRTKWRKCIALLAGLALMLGALVVFGAQPAAAMPGLVKRVATSPTDSVSPKTATAVCPAGTRAVGGGGFVFALSAADESKVVLTAAAPSLTGSSYAATGTEIAPGMPGNWWVEAYALCATTPAGYQVVTATTAPSSNSTQQTAAVCPSGKRVFGTGARIDNPGGEVTLQLTRSDIPRGIARVTAKEDANGYAGTWSVTAFAICANDLPGFTLVSRASAFNSEDTKLVDASCPTGTFVHSVAFATSGGTPPSLDTTPPGVGVQVLFPFSGLRSAQVFVVETTPTSVNWDVGIFLVCGP